MLPSALETAIERYIELEREIDRLTSEKFTVVCADCGGLCCRAGYANMTIRSWFLREVSRRVHGNWWPDGWETRNGCVAQAETGCVLHVGRPPLCRQWLCGPYLGPCRDIWEVVFYTFVSELMPQTLRPSPKLDLVEMAAEQAHAHAEIIAERIEESHRLLPVAKRLIDEKASESDKCRVALGILWSAPILLQTPTREAIPGRLEGAGRSNSQRHA
jgi:hypothetical protein